jgi:hypothetical protein
VTIEIDPTIFVVVLCMNSIRITPNINKTNNHHSSKSMFEFVFNIVFIRVGAGAAQSVVTVGWKYKELRLDSRKGIFLFCELSHRPGAHPTTYSMGKGDPSPGVKRLVVKLIADLHLVPRMRGTIPPLLPITSWCGTL